MRRAMAGWVLAATLAAPASGQLLTPRDSEAPEIAIDAATMAYDQKRNVVSASGHVVIRRGETEVRADTVEVDRATNEVTATGNVQVHDLEGTLFADRVRLNLDDETSTIERGALTSRRLRYSLTGDRIEKRIGQQYHIQNGTFTTCDCEEGPPSWSISGQEVDVALGGYGTVRGGTFNVLDVPVFYVPHALIPVGRERQSGLLLPRMSASNRRGFQLLAPAYWAINRSHDVTLEFDVETAARVGLLGEYRYAVARDFEGSISPAYFNESFRGANRTAGVDVPENRWSVVGDHTNGIGPATAYADVFLVGDDGFLRDMNTFTINPRREVAIRTLPFTTSRAGLFREWDRVAVRAQGTYFQDLTNEQVPTDPALDPFSDQLTIQRLPDVNAWGQWVLGDHLFTHVAASGTDFVRRQGIAGLRFHVAPEAVVPVQLGRAAFGALHARFRGAAYHLFETEMTGGFPGNEANAAPFSLPADSTTETVRLSANAGTALSRVYDFDSFGISKLKHTLEPVAEYAFVPNVAQDDLPVFDGEDRERFRSLFTYGVVNRLLAKTAAGEATAENGGETNGNEARIHELARFSVVQSFDTQREIPPVSGSGGADHFSDLGFALRVQPVSTLLLRTNLDYNTSSAEFSDASVGFRFRGEGRGARERDRRLEVRNTLGVTYRFITSGLLEQVDGNLLLRLTDRLGFLYGGAYDLQNSRSLDNYFGLRMLSACDCWGLELVVVNKTNPQEIEARVQVTLAGLGSAGRPSSNAEAGMP